VAGAGGFIGGHLVAHLRKQGIRNLRAVDLKPFSEWYQKFDDVDNHQLDLRELEACRKAAKGMEWIYNLAADMGGMGFIELHKAECMLSVLINTHMLMAAQGGGSQTLFLCLLGLRVRCGQADHAGESWVEGVGRLPGHAGGRLRLGKAFQ